MWDARSEYLADTCGLRFTLQLSSRPATVADVLRGWREDAEFRSLFNSLLAAAPFTTFRWETPAVTTSTTVRAFEFVLLDSPGLAQYPDPEAFAEHYVTATDGVATFSNLGGDAILVVPSPLSEPAAYAHVAAFVRLAPEPQRDTLWRRVGEAMARRVGDKPVWLSTAGAGVSWLHVRLDDRPKYYGFAPYRKGA
jgi:uncharacterized protein DUF6940